jgi:hypothetical protein
MKRGKDDFAKKRQGQGQNQSSSLAEGSTEVSFSTTPMFEQGSEVSFGYSSMQQNRYNFSLINCRTSSKASFNTNQPPAF